MAIILNSVGGGITLSSKGVRGDDGAAGSISPFSAPSVLNSSTWEELQDYVDENIYAYSVSTAEEDPSSGNVRFNNTDLNLATEVYFSDTTVQGANIDLFVNAAVTGTVLVLREFGDFSKDIIFSVDSITDNTTWYKFGITVLSSTTFIADGVNLLFRVLNIPVSHDPTLSGLGTVASPLAIASVSSQRTISTASPSAILITDGTILFDSALVKISIDLPLASVGKVKIPFKDSGCNSSNKNITINRAGSNTIVDSAINQTSTIISSNGFSGYFLSDGVDTWYLL